MGWHSRFHYSVWGLSFRGRVCHYTEPRLGPFTLGRRRGPAGTNSRERSGAGRGSGRGAAAAARGQGRAGQGQGQGSARCLLRGRSPDGPSWGQWKPTQQLEGPSVTAF